MCPACGTLQPKASQPVAPAEPTGPGAAPPGFAAGVGIPGTQGAGVPPTVPPAIVPPREPVRRPPPKRSNGPLIFGAIAVLAVVGLIFALQKGLESSDDAKSAPTKTVESTAVPSNPNNDPKVVEFVRDYCSLTDKSLASEVPPYEPGETAYTSVFYKQAIGAPGQRTGWVLMPTSPEVGSPMDPDEFLAIDATDVRLAACLEIGPGEPTELNCTYTQTNPNLPEGDQFTMLMRTPYIVRVYEIHTGEVVATGSVATADDVCPEEALVELSDNVSGPMTEAIIATWFTEHFVDGVPR